MNNVINLFFQQVHDIYLKINHPLVVENYNIFFLKFFYIFNIFKLYEYVGITQMN